MPKVVVQKIDEEQGKDVNGGMIKGYSGGYCPYTPDRCCKIESVGNWKADSEDCKECGYRAW